MTNKLILKTNKLRAIQEYLGLLLQYYYSCQTNLFFSCMAKHPKILYKYVNVETFLKMFTYENYLDSSWINNWPRILRRNPTIKFSKVNEFRGNDFIDTLPMIEDQCLKDLFLQEANKIVEKLISLPTIHKERLSLNSNEPWDIYNKIVEIYTETMIMDNHSSNPEEYSSNEVLNIIDDSKMRELLVKYLNKTEGSAYNFRNEFSKNFGVFCLTKNEFNTAMWSHYARNDGFVIGYDMDHEFFKDKSIQLLKIKYSKERPSLNNDTLFQAIDNFNLNHSIFFTKHENWKYENEYRLVKKFQSDEKRILEIPIEAVKEINIGLINYPLDEKSFIGRKFKTVYHPEKHRKDYDKVERFREHIRRNDYKKIKLIINRWLENMNEEDYGIINRMLPYGKNGYKKIPISKYGVNIRY